MNSISLSVIGIISLGLVGCAGMTAEEKCTAGGAVIGGVAGAAIGDNPVATVGGAAVGGVIGHEVGEKGKCR